MAREGWTQADQPQAAEKAAAPGPDVNRRRPRPSHPAPPAAAPQQERVGQAYALGRDAPGGFNQGSQERPLRASGGSREGCAKTGSWVGGKRKEPVPEAGLQGAAGREGGDATVRPGSTSLVLAQRWRATLQVRVLLEHVRVLRVPLAHHERAPAPWAVYGPPTVQAGLLLLHLRLAVAGHVQRGIVVAAVLYEAQLLAV